MGEAAWALARRQTGGKGRQGRGWESIEGNLHASTLVQPKADDPPPATLSMVAAIALHRALVEGSEIPPNRLRIKWPNDLIACREGQWRKLAGILLEREGDAIVAGFGANLAHAPAIPNRPVASAAEYGEPPDPVRFCFTLGKHFAHELDRWRTRGVADIRRRWLDRATPIGTQITVHGGAGSVMSGSFCGLEADGALRLETADGVEIVRAGDVSL